MYDLVLQGGLIVDGTRAEPYKANVCILDGKIAKITGEAVSDAKEVVDVSGLTVTPGFIDIHSHSDSTYLSEKPLESHLAQGVTTQIAGNCGSSKVPAVVKKPEGEPRELFEMKDYVLDVNAHNPLMNYGELVGHSALRIAVMGYENRDPNPEEMEKLKALLDRQMAQGAFGMSLGLIYPPSAFSAKEELIELAKVIAKYDGILSVHMRNEGPRLFEAVDEVIEIVEKSGVHLEISHLKLMGKPQWGKAQQLLEKIKGARARGLNITCDQYPFLASSTSMTALLPHWAHAGGKEQMIARVRSKEGNICEEIAKEMGNRGGPDTILVFWVDGHSQWQGKFISQLAEEFGLSPVDTVIKVLGESGCNAKCIYFCINEGDMLKIMSEKFICVGSDGADKSLDPNATKTIFHPRNYAAFSQFFQTVREHQLMPIQDAVYKMTGLTAQILGIRDRGVLKEGMAADIAVFDAETFGSNSTFLAPCARPTGVHHVIVNGQLTVRDGKLTENRAGKALLKQ